MKNVLVVLTIAISSVIAFSAAGQAGPDARARELIQTLHLRVLPRESGYLEIIGVSEQTATVDGRTLAVQSQNYYLLTRERPINYLHWLVPDRVKIGAGPDWVKLFSNAAPWATPKALRDLIGPNWMPQ